MLSRTRSLALMRPSINTLSLLTTFQENQSVLRSMIWPYVKTPEDIEDLLHEVYIKAHINLHKFRGDCALTTWLCRIARNTAITRAVSTGKSEPYDETQHLSSKDPEQDCITERQWATLNQNIYALPQPQRNMLSLYYLANYCLEDIAAICDIPVGTVKSRLARSRQTLRALDNMEQSPPPEC